MKKINSKILALFLALAMIVPFLPPAEAKADSGNPVFKSQISNFVWMEGTDATYVIEAQGAVSDSVLVYDWFIVYDGNIYDTQDASSCSALPMVYEASSGTFIIKSIESAMDGAEIFCIVRDTKYGTHVQSDMGLISVYGSSVPPSEWVTSTNAWTTHYQVDSSSNYTYGISWNIASTEFVSSQSTYNYKYRWYQLDAGESACNNNNAAITRYGCANTLVSDESTDPTFYATYPGSAGRTYYVCQVSYENNGSSGYSTSPVIEIDWDTYYEEPDCFIVGLRPEKTTYTANAGDSINDIGMKFAFETSMGYPTVFPLSASRFVFKDQSTGNNITKFENAGTYTIYPKYGSVDSAEITVMVASTATNTPTPTATNTPTPTATNTPTPEPTATNTPTPEPTATSTPTPTATPVPTATSTPVPTATPTTAPTDTPTPTPEEATPTPEEATPTPEEATPTPTDAATPTPVQEENTPTAKVENTPTPTLVPTNTPVPTASPTPVPGETATKLNVPLVVTLVVVIALLAAVVGVLSTVIFMKKKYGDISKSGDKPEETDKDETKE